MTTADILAHPRFRQAIRSGEYSRSISVFLRLQFPEVEDLSVLSLEVKRAAQYEVDQAFFEKLASIEEMEKEMI